MEKFGIGQPVRRSEDLRFLTGKGQYVDDIRFEDQLYGVVVRSVHAHANILSVDTEQARALPGVHGVFTGEDWAAEGLGGIPAPTPVKHPDGSTVVAPERPSLIKDRVRFVGDAIAFVVAESTEIARDAAELVEVEYEELPLVTDAAAALAPDAPQIWEHIEGNVCVDFKIGDADAVAKAFESAAHITQLELFNNRVTAVSIEPRGAVAKYDAASESFEFVCATQNVHSNRNGLADKVLHIPKDKIHLVANDIGGGFGVKNGVYPEYALVLFAARRLNRPVKWIADRSESFLSDSHGRDQRSKVELALDKDAHFLALRTNSVGNIGAYMLSVGPFTPTGGSARTQGGPYRIPLMSYTSKAVFTNTVPMGPYRGAGRPEASFQVERVIELAAKELGIDPLVLRRKNLLRRQDIPYTTGVGTVVDSGDFEVVLNRALELADWQGFDARKKSSRARGQLRGIGIVPYFECSGGAGQEFASLSFDQQGGMTLAVGTHSVGMGHETVLPQIVADRLGVDFNVIRFLQGDTDATPSSGGHGGSRTLEVGGAAIVSVVDKVIAKAKEIAAHQLEAAEVDIEFNAGEFTVAGTDRKLTIQEVVMSSFDPQQLPEGMSPGLDDSADYTREKITYPNGCHVVEVEVDRPTGSVALATYTIVDDFGNVINPLTTEGQVLGGTTQGIGQALLENISYDPESGQLLTGSMMDYGLPRAADLPEFKCGFYEGAPTKSNPLGVKGAGEAGCCGSMPAIVNAVLNALSDYDVRHIDMPLTSEKIWRAMQV